MAFFFGKNTPARKIPYPGDGPIIKSVTSGKFTDPLTLSRHHLRTLVTIFFLHFAVHLLAPKKAQRILGRLIRLLGKILVPFLEAGQLYYQPKQCNRMREIPQCSIHFSINFDFPKKWVAWKNIMTSPRLIQKTHPISTHPKKRQKNVLHGRSSSCYSAFWRFAFLGTVGSWWHLTAPFLPCSVDPQRKKHTLQGINLIHLGKRKLIFKMPFLGDMLVPWRVFQMRTLQNPKETTSPPCLPQGYYMLLLLSIENKSRLKWWSTSFSHEGQSGTHGFPQYPEDPCTV